MPELGASEGSNRATSPNYGTVSNLTSNTKYLTSQLKYFKPFYSNSAFDVFGYDNVPSIFRWLAEKARLARLWLSSLRL